MSNDTNVHPIPSILGNQESKNNNDMDILMAQNGRTLNQQKNEYK
jgi:hypothetical protein